MVNRRAVSPAPNRVTVKNKYAENTELLNCIKYCCLPRLEPKIVFLSVEKRLASVRQVFT